MGMMPQCVFFQTARNAMCIIDVSSRPPQTLKMCAFMATELSVLSFRHACAHFIWRVVLAHAGASKARLNILKPPAKPSEYVDGMAESEDVIAMPCTRKIKTKGSPLGLGAPAPLAPEPPAPPAAPPPTEPPVDAPTLLPTEAPTDAPTLFMAFDNERSGK